MDQYDDAKVGDDLSLQIVLKGEDGSEQPLDAAWVTIAYLDSPGDLVVEEAVATAVTDAEAFYSWTPAAPGTYAVEWHTQHGGGIDTYHPDIRLFVRARHAP
jgi:hypothetical protein